MAYGSFRIETGCSVLVPADRLLSALWLLWMKGEKERVKEILVGALQKQGMSFVIDCELQKELMLDSF